MKEFIDVGAFCFACERTAIDKRRKMYISPMKGSVAMSRFEAPPPFPYGSPFKFKKPLRDRWLVDRIEILPSMLLVFSSVSLDITFELSSHHKIKNNSKLFYDI